MRSRIPQIVFLLLLGGYACFALSLGNGPMQDVPNHLARARIVADLLFNGGLVHGADFQFHLSYRPYLLGDLVLAVVDNYLGGNWAARLWIATSVLLMPLAVRSALRSLRLPPDAVCTGAVLSLYLATGWTFTMGFLNYQIALACSLFTFTWFVRAQDSSDARVWLGYAVLAIVSYAMHLSALLFICAFAGTIALVHVMQRRYSAWRAAALLAVPGVLLIAHYALGDSGAPADAGAAWGTLHRKLTYLFSPVVRFHLRADLLLFGAFLVAALLPLVGVRSLAAQKWTLPLWLCVAAFVGLYFALPYVADNIYHVDLRALPYALAFLLFAGVATGQGFPSLARWQFAGACVLATVNLFYITSVMKTEDRRLGDYRAIAAAVPAGAHVLPVNARPAIGRYSPFYHAGAYATYDARAITPYLFAADLNPPMSYFHYAAHRDYAPYEVWYEDDVREARAIAPGAGDTLFMPDWNKVEQQYQYLLVTVPWDPALIPARYTVAVRNDVAALLKIPQP